MPSKSKAQQRLMGQAWAIRKHDFNPKKANPKAEKIADGKMKDKDLKAFASTKHKGLPERVKEELEKGRLEALRESQNSDQQVLSETKQKSSKEASKSSTEGTSLSSSKFNTFSDYKYANRYKPQCQEPMIQSKTIVILPMATHAVGVFIAAFKEKNFEFAKVRTKRLLSAEASLVLKPKKDKKWYKEVRDKLIAGPSVALLFNYKGEDIEKDFKSACEKIRRVLKLKALHEAFVYDINNSPYFAGINVL